MKSLDGKVVVLTGAGSGIGRALTVLLGKAGCKLALADIDQHALEQTCELLPETVQTFCQTVDVSIQEQIHTFADSTIHHFGCVDVVINNAGVSLSQTITDMDIGEMKWLMDINFWGTVYGCKSFLPHLLQRRDAHIVNISSVFGLIATPTQAAYSASKFAVRGFTETLRQEMKGTVVNVSCVIPGGIKTNIVKNSHFHLGPDEAISKKEAAERFEQMATITPEKAAQVIVNGILSNRKRIFIGSDARLIDIIARLLPVRCEFFLGKGVAN